MRRSLWTNRFPGLPFYTLGVAGYLDAGPGRTGYRERAEALNPVLDADFGWLYDRLLATLREELRAPVGFAPDAARPGFHIFLAHEAFRRPLGRIHFDLQHLDIPWECPEAMDASRPFSFTLPIALPRAGAGLEFWNIGRPEFDAKSATEKARIPDDHPPEQIRYRLGELVCHSGLLLHRLAPATGELFPDDRRVTLQGHALPAGGRYRAYW